MRKEFNREDYDYLDESLIDNYISEILLRNPTFLKEYKKFMKLIDYMEKCEMATNLYKKYKVHVRHNPSKKNDIARLPSPVGAFRLLSPRDKDREIKEEYLGDKWENLDSKSAQWTYYGTPGEQDCDVNLDAALFHDYFDGEHINRDTLLLAINLNASKEIIENDINKILAIHKKRKKGNIRLAKWKYYLIVYDLYKSGMSYKEIADCLRHAYPDNKNFFDEKNIENYYKNALDLINGGYKKYI